MVVAAPKRKRPKRKLTGTIAIVDTGGNLVYFQRPPTVPATAEAFA